MRIASAKGCASIKKRGCATEERGLPQAESVRAPPAKPICRIEFRARENLHRRETEKPNTPPQKTKSMNYDTLHKAVSGTAAALRSRTKLQPAGGEGDKVFPPTYAGAVYAREERQIDGKKVPCVLLDSVQAQANRLEEALQRALDAGSLKNVPVLNVDFTGLGLLDEVGRV